MVPTSIVYKYAVLYTVLSRMVTISAFAQYLILGSVKISYHAPRGGGDQPMRVKKRKIGVDQTMHAKSLR